jgi:hypothetical protein
MAGLNRIVLIDTHLPGVVELKLDGHTNICGTNASGKTTLQRLIPVFYGEYPSRVVPATRDSFERWYLPRTSSFIIYEYTRAAGDLCQAVLSSNGSGVNYRLIGKPFAIEDYLIAQKNGKHTSVGSAELARALKRNDVLVTSLLSTKDFRAIIQNDNGALNQSSNARELLGYAKVFSLCEPNKHMRHIEKLAKAVHSKEGKMETIKAMIAAILEEDGVTPPTSGLSRHRVDDWIKECQLIKQFDHIRPEFSKLEQAEMALTSTEQLLANLKHSFELDKAHLAARIESTKNELEENQFNRKQADNQWHDTRDHLNQVISSARADVEKYTHELEAVEKEFDKWQEEDIEQLKADVANLPQWQNSRELAESRYHLLTEKHQDIDAAYNRRIAELGENLTSTLEELSALRQEAGETKAQYQQQERETIQKIKDDFSSQLNALHNEHQTQLNALNVTEAELKSSLSNAGYNEFEQSQLDLLDGAIKEASLSEDAARVAYRDAQKNYNKAVQLREQSSIALDKARVAFQQEEKAVAQTNRLLYPGEGSLLEFLRKNVDDWENTLGKVIRSELLSRTDLSPSLSEDSASLIGVKLAFDNVDTPEFAQSEQALKQRLKDAELRQAAALAAQNECETNLAKANEEVRNLELVMTQKDNEVKSAEASRKRAQQDRDSLLSEYQQALSKRKQKAKSKLEANQQAQKNANAQFELSRDEIRDQQREAETEHGFHWQQLIADSEARIAQIDNDINKAKADAATARKEMQAWLENELNNRGVDVDEIGQLKKQITTLKENITRTENKRHKVADYERWYSTVFSQQKVTWQEGLSKARKALGEAERSLAQQQSVYKNQREALQEQHTQLDTKLKTASEHAEQIKTLSKSLNKLTLHAASQDIEVKHDDVSISQRISEVQGYLQERDTLLSDIRTYVERFDQLIAAQAGTGLSDTWERAREECATINAQGVKSVDHRRMVKHLSQLLNVIVPQKLQGLREQGRIFGADLSQYYFVLADIDKRIVTQSRRITEEVDSELFLDGVSDSAVKIRSRISELEFWPELEHFRTLYQQWMDEGANNLPDEEYGMSMRRVLDILGRAALTGGINKLLDIELHLREGKSDLVIRTDRQLNESSSHGMAYLILCKFLLAFTRLLRGDAEATVHWPIDELGTLHQSNVKKIFDACQNNNISVVGAFPNPESEVLTLFENRYLIDKVTRQLQVVQPKTSAISQRLKARKEAQEGSKETSL